MTFAWFLVIIFTLLLTASIYVNVKVIKTNLVLSDQREQLVDQIEESLDMLDECYTRMAHNAEIPVLSDEPVIREVISDIKRAKNTVLAIAGKVVTYGDERGAPKGDE